MSVYIDPLIVWKESFGPSCHLFADSTQELLLFIRRMGISDKAIQRKRGKMPHCDFKSHRRKIAVRKGAIEVSLKVTAEYVRKYRKKECV